MLRLTVIIADLGVTAVLTGRDHPKSCLMKFERCNTHNFRTHIHHNTLNTQRYLEILIEILYPPILTADNGSLR